MQFSGKFDQTIGCGPHLCVGVPNLGNPPLLTNAIKQQWRIQNFPEWVPTLGDGANILFDNFSLMVHKNEEILVRGGAHP